MVSKKVTVIETPMGFLWTERGRYYKTVKGLKTAIRRDDKQMAKYHKVVATLLEIY
jgi:hypothetical protein